MPPTELGGPTTWVKSAEPLRDHYIPRMDWVDGRTLVLQNMNRLQNRNDVLLADVSTGESRILLTETAPSWIDLAGDITWVNDGRQFIWMSERDGYNHLYLYDRAGALVRQLTEGRWEVMALEGVDEDQDWAYFTAANPTPLAISWVLDDYVAQLAEAAGR